MTTKTLYLFCAQVFLFQTISGYYNNPAIGTGLLAGESLGWATPGIGYEAPLPTGPCPAPAPFLGAYDLAAIPSSYGGGFSISSASPISPYGISVKSENTIEGILGVGGELPFLGTVALEGAIPTVGAGTVSYGCGNGNVGMVSEDILPMAPAMGLGWPAAGFNYGPVLGNGFGYSTTWAAPATEYGYGCSSLL